MRIQEPAAEYIVDRKGRKKAVLLGLAQYEKLLEDLHDLAEIAGRRKGKAVPFMKLKARSRKNGRV